ncbi:cysteine-rich receptor-like protein kinase 26 [Momordica charantia]|uniref:Cysteine-rich receptor-like protein kinase 26 n=1 Tax=Momordica charantia TaxID=3673 RepID=A0A6J1CH66_MOMCH|nr:cysteine-rich receptor-like protein kinase 26 [Momordica charantia]XP_022140078.1 cysteine-rich receptor-like protein kinase 26 [Momordica charantia]
MILQQQFAMPSPTSLSFFFLTLIAHPLAFAQPRFLAHFCVNGSNNNTAAAYRANLDHLLSTLTTDHQIDYGFYNFSYGHENRANVIGLCRGDISPEACRRCLNYSRDLLPLRCPTQNEAIGWYDNCMLRYSDRPIFGSMEILPRQYLWNVNNASDGEGFTQAARNLIVDLIGEATAGDSRVKFAIGNATVPRFPTIYGLAQCTPDLSRRQCNECLVGALPLIRECCDGKKGGRVLRPSCHFRYESYPLLQSPPSSPPPPPPLSQPPPPPLLLNRTTDGNTNNKSVTSIAVAVPTGLVVVVAVLMIIICMFMRRRPEIDGTKRGSEEEIPTVGFLQFDFDIIRIATDGFSDANRLGEGGFGAVYKGKLPNGRTAAVKRLSQISRQGDVEFKNEVVLVAKLHHRNLVKLLGFCSKENEKLLIYEFLQNGSLEKIIFDPVKRLCLDWAKRYKIIKGITRGLIYLHEDSRIKIIHRDLKASNILLDAEMNAKISDFGTARLFLSEQTRGNTSTIIGTYGYMAPEYVKHGHLSAKSDVFSFGVLVLEIVTGKSNHMGSNENIEDHLISYAWRNWREGRALNIVDPSIKIQSGMRNEVAICIQIGLLCIQEKVCERPSMASVLVMLNSDLADLPTPSHPSFFMDIKQTSQITELGLNQI